MGDIRTGIDIGTTKICTVIADYNGDVPEVLGIGVSQSEGLRKGVVVNVESTIHSIRRSVEAAEKMAGFGINKAFVGIAGSHIKGFNSHGIHAIKSAEITQEDIDSVFDAAKAVKVPEDREIIDVLPQEYIVDDQRGISDPVGMVGVRLEANVHIVTAATSSVKNLKNCALRAGINDFQLIFQPLASAEAILNREERNLGVCLVDFGGGTTDIVIYQDGSIKHTAVLGIGGNNLTNDLSVGLRTPLGEAEKIKIKHGTCMASVIDEDALIEVPSVGGRKPRKIAHQVLAEILEPRIEEILNLVDQELKKTGLKNGINAGVVFTGGSSLLPGLMDMASQIFQQPARLGFPEGISGLPPEFLRPQYATSIGLVLYAYRYRFSVEPGGSGESLYNKARAVIRSIFKP